MKELTQAQLELRSKIYGAITWICLGLILLWYVLKSTGIINTPLWIELMPVAIAVFGAGAFIQRMHGDIVTVKSDMHLIKKLLVKHDTRLTHIEKKLAV